MTFCLQMLWINKEILQKRIYLKNFPFGRQAGITNSFAEKTPNTKNTRKGIFFFKAVQIIFVRFNFIYCFVCLLGVVASFGTSKEIMKMIYVRIVRVILEGSCQVWDGGLIRKNIKSFERLQNQCLSLRIISPNIKYKEALKQLDLVDLQTRRTELTKRFAKLDQNNGNLANFYKKNPKKPHNIKRQNTRVYNIKGNTKQFMNSPVLHMKRL